MFFIRSKLAALLRPWLQSEPDLELKLGFLSSHGSAQDLVFDVSALNLLIDESSCLYFKDVRVGKLSFRVTPWSIPAFAVELHGLHVTLTVREQTNKWNSQSSTDWSLKEKKEILSVIDPEGSALHDSLERISIITPGRNRLMTSLWNVVLNHSQLQVHDIQLEVQLPGMDDFFAYLLKMKDLSLEALHVKSTCLLSGLISAFFVSQNLCFLVLNSCSLELGFKGQENFRCIASGIDLYGTTKFRDQQFLNLDFYTSQLNFAFFPTDLPLLLAFDTLLTKEVKRVRNGRELWKIAARRFVFLGSNLKLSFGKLVDMLVLRLRHVRAYESLLLLVGYPIETTFNKSSTRMPFDKKFSVHVQNQWKDVCEIEKDLPADVLVQTRRIARHRAAMSVHCTESSCSESQLQSYRKLFQKLLSLLSFLLKILCYLPKSAIRFFFMGAVGKKHVEADSALEIVSGYSRSHYCFAFRRISITISPASAAPSPINQREAPNDISSISLLSFYMVFDAVFLIYMCDNAGQSTSLCCGDIHAKSLSSYKSYAVPLSENDWGKETDGSFKEYVKEENNGLKVLWSDRAPQSLEIEKVASDSFIPVGNVLLSHLERQLKEMWLNWKTVSEKFVGFEKEYLESPMLLCEFKSTLMDPGLLLPDCGVGQFILSMGKLNFDFGYSSVISIFLLLWQVQHILDWGSSKGNIGIISHSQNISTELKEINLEDCYKSCVSELKIAMCRMMPEKKIRMGVAIGGARVRISLQEEGLLGVEGQGHGDLDIMLDLDTVELALWPSLKATLPSFTEEQRLDDAEIESARFMRTSSLNIPGVNMSKSYICQGQIILNSWLIMNGLKAYLQKSEEKQHLQVIDLPSAFVRTLFRREYVYSLTTNVTTLSTSVHGMVAEIMISLYMDEVRLFLQVADSMLSAAIYAFTNSNSIANLRFHEIATKMGESYEEDQVAEGKAASLIHKNTLVIADASVEFRSLAMIAHNSRKILATENHKKVNDAYTSRNEYLSILAVSEHGIGVAVENQHIQMSCKGGHARAHLNLSAIHSVIFKYPSPSEDCSRVDLTKLFYKFPYCLYEFCISDCAIVLLADPSEDALVSLDVHDTANFSTSGGEISSGVEHPASTIIIDHLSMQHTSNKDSRRCDRRFSNLLPLSCYQFLIDIVIGEICLAQHCLKNVLSKAHEPEKHQSSLSVGGGLNRISWTMQGGIIFVEMAAFVMFTNCVGAYLLHILNLSTFSSFRNMSSGRSETCSTTKAFKWQLLEAFVIKLINLALVLVVVDNSSEVWELTLKVDFYFNHELMNSRRRITFDLQQLAIFSKYVHDNNVELIKEVDEIPHFSSDSVKFLSSHSVAGGPTQESIAKENIVPILYDEHSSSSTVPHLEYTMRNDVTRDSHSNVGNYMLKHGYASIWIEKDVSHVTAGEVGCLWLKNNWVGSGSISGLDLTFSLSEIKMLQSLFAPLSSIQNKDTPTKPKQRHIPREQEKDNSSELTIPDGAVVAIQDLHEHMYFAVEGVDNRYRLIGAVHYSLIGQRALFRVKYCKRKSWGLPASCFTLISLHARSGLGEPLRLNYRPGSAFIDISSTDDSSLALWKKLPYKPENYDDYKDVEYFNQLSKNTFYLVNHKCNQAVAFVEGVPEFVKKPGNLFKFKLFSDCHGALDALRPRIPLDSAGTTNLPHNDHVNADQNSVMDSSFPCVHITINKATMTILHELPHAIEKFPLLRACIDNTQFVLQVIPMKARLMGMFTTGILYFDARGNLWRELVHPVETCVFYHSRLAYQDGSEIIEPQRPVHLYFRSSQVDVSLTGLSLDIILFVIGELNLAGPYAVRSSLIFANCCKVENQSGLNLLCHFYDDQDAIIAGKQSASVFLRQIPLANALLDKSSFVSLQLAAIGTFRTSAIRVSLMTARILAWRTRVLSLQDSRSYPGPFVVVDVSKKNEDVLSITVSPLLRIHNETGFSLTMRFSRPQQREAESAFILLRTGDAIDDSMAALDAINLCGGSKKALMSLCLGDFLLSFRPEITEHLEQSRKPISSEWSEELKGGKAVRLSGILDKLTYKFKKALGVESMKYSFSTVRCSLNVEGAHVTDLHFLIQTCRRDVPVIQPDGLRDKPETSNSPISLQEQKEIFLLPTFQVFNLLQSEIHVLLTESHPDLSISEGCNNIGKQATIARGSSTYLYGNPATIYFTVTLTTFNSRCKPVNSGDWVKKLQKQKHNAHYLDVELDFGGGKYFSYLRLSLGEKGILEVAVFTPYTVQNDSHLTFLCFSSNQKPLSRTEAEKYGPHLPPELGVLLPPQSITSWFSKSNRVHLTLLEEKASVALLDFDVLSGFTEVCLEVHDSAGMKYISKLGVSLKPCHSKIILPSQIVLMVPRYIVSNESEDTIFVRQCYFEDDMDGSIAINSKQRAPLCIKTEAYKRKEVNALDSLLKKHRNVNEDSFVFVQFHLNDAGWSWSGPICIASLGRFYLKFRRSSDSIGNKSNLILKQEHRLREIALVHLVEEGSSLVLHFYRPTNISSPYRIENILRNAAITYHQKDSPDSEILGSGKSVDYVWDDLNLPHQLVVQINDLNLSREINIDKLHAWKPFFKVRQQRGLALDFPSEKMSRERRTKHDSLGPELPSVGYEVYVDGCTRVLRISEFPNRCKDDSVCHPSAKLQFIVSHFVIHLIENEKQDEANASPIYSPFLVARLGNINLNSVVTDLAKYNQIKIRSLDVDEKWVGAPFAAMLRRNQLDYCEENVNMLKVTLIILSTNSNVKQVKYSSVILQPINLNIDEETLMRLVPFWRTSLSDSSSPSKQFYFKHFEIHPVKIVASFLPGTSGSNYSSAQETLRSLLHSVIKIPAVKNMSVELNGILVTHALVTARELFFKCAQHYSWYAMRAVYIAKGSPLLPPAFASIFDDSASSSLDVFFDPSSGLINLPGLTLGMFKLISKSIHKKGFSGTKRYFGDLGKTVKTAGSNVLFAAVTEISDCVLKGAEANGFNGMVNGFHQGILKLAMEPSLIGSAVLEGGPDRKIKLDSSPGVDEFMANSSLNKFILPAIQKLLRHFVPSLHPYIETHMQLYIEGYLQAMLDTLYKQEYLRVRVIDNLVILKNLPPNSSLMNEIMDRVKDFLISRALLKGEVSSSSRPLRHLRGENEWRIGPTVLTLWEHLFVSFAIRMLRKQTLRFTANLKWKGKSAGNSNNVIVPLEEKRGWKHNMKSGFKKFIFSGLVAYIDGRLCRCIPNGVARRIVSGFLLSLLDDNDSK